MIGHSSPLTRFHSINGESRRYLSTNRQPERTICNSLTAVAPPIASPSDDMEASNKIESMVSIPMMQSIRRLRLVAAGLRQRLSPHDVPLSLAALPPLAISDLLSNQVFMSGLIGFLAAQIGKIFTERYKRGYWNLMAFTQPGGTPSALASRLPLL